MYAKHKNVGHQNVLELLVFSLGYWPVRVWRHLKTVLLFLFPPHRRKIKIFIYVIPIRCVINNGCAFLNSGSGINMELCFCFQEVDFADVLTTAQWSKHQCFCVIIIGSTRTNKFYSLMFWWPFLILYGLRTEHVNTRDTRGKFNTLKHMSADYYIEHHRAVRKLRKGKYYYKLLGPTKLATLFLRCIKLIIFLFQNFSIKYLFTKENFMRNWNHLTNWLKSFKFLLL